MEKAGGLVNDLRPPKPVKYLKKILHNSVFCTICLDINDDLLHLNDSMCKADWEGHALPIREVLEGIFGSMDVLFSEYICEPCKSSAASSYSFISKAKRTAETFTEYLKQLDKETTDLASRMINMDWKNAMIVLEDGSCKKTTIKPKKQSVTPSYVCDLCGKGFLRKENLIKHLRLHKDSSKFLKCPHCINHPCMHEKYILAFNEQLMLKLEQITCVECGENVKRTLPDLIAHANKQHLNIITNTCKECGKSFYLASHYKKHFEYHHNNKHTCKSCFRKFRSEKQVHTHMETCKTTVKFFKCDHCPVLSETELNNKFHMSTHLRGYPEKRMKRNPETRQKMKRIKRIYKCSICEKVLKTQHQLRAHVGMHGKKPNLCLYCNKQFGSRQEYLDHVQTDEHRKKVPYNTFKHHCSYCDYATNTIAMLEAHVNRIHLNVRPFQCGHCQNSYFDEKQLKNHMKIHTGQVKQKVCDICGAHLAGPTALKKHRRIHTGERPYPCPYCDAKATCATSLKMHVMRKHMEATISCPLCSTKFHTMTNAREHVKKAHWKSKEKFDYTKLKGLSPKDYEFFRDRRKALL